jgi:signal transduction histidine kinase
MQAMLNHFLEANRAALIERCRAKVALRPVPHAMQVELAHGIPVFLAQLIETLRADELPDALLADPGPAIAASARKHGDEMMHRGFTIDQVVHDYGDLCQAITELAAESGTRISADDFQLLNRCLDDAIAGAITEFQAQREREIRARERREEAGRIGSLAHELRDLLGTATLAFRPLKRGSIGSSGATSAVLERSLAAMGDIIARTVADVRLDAIPVRFESIRLDRFIAEAQASARLSPSFLECDLEVLPIESTLFTRADRQLLHCAVANLLGNAFKFSRKPGHVTLQACGNDERVLIEVCDECGGLPEGKAAALFASFEQHGDDRTGLGLGLSIARRAVEAMDGSLRVRDLPGTGCIFTIDLPRERAGPEAIRSAAAGATLLNAANDDRGTPEPGEAPRCRVMAVGAAPTSPERNIR